MKRTSETYRPIMKDLMFVSLEISEREEKEGGAEKIFKEIMAENSQMGQIRYRNRKVSKSTVHTQ